VEVNIHEAKTHLSRLIERVLAGEQVVIARRGLPVAKLTRVRMQAQGRKLGSAAGTVEFLPGWDEPMTAEELDRFLGR
jgi:prevent-host-death family protein